jgi:hypothetical protein
MRVGRTVRVKEMEVRVKTDFSRLGIGVEE